MAKTGNVLPNFVDFIPKKREIIIAIMTMLKDKIRSLREQQGLTQEQFAAKLNTSTSSYARLESGETQITMEKLNKICKVLGKDILELLDSSNNVSLSASNNNDHSQSHHAQTQTNFLPYAELFLRQ